MKKKTRKNSEEMLKIMLNSFASHKSSIKCLHDVDIPISKKFISDKFSTELQSATDVDLCNLPSVGPGRGNACRRAEEN